MRALVLLSLLSVAASAAPNFDRKFSAYDKQDGPGLALLVLKDGKPAFQKGYGLARTDAKKFKIDEHTNFNLASDSKQFTGLLTLILEQKGLLSEHDLVSQYIPELPAYAKTLRIEHLLGHMGGLPDYMDVCEKKPKIYNADVLDYLKTKDKADFEPARASPTATRAS